MGDYCTTAEFRAYLGDTSTIDEAVLDDCIAAAEAEINTICDRTFTQAASASARLYHPDTPYKLTPDDISTTSGLIVQVGTGDGTYGTTWTTEYQLEPLNGIRNGIAGWPYDRLCAVDGNRFTCSLTGRPTVQITAKWGWAAVPDAIKMATKILAKDDYQSKDIRGGTVGFGDFGAVRARDGDRFKNLVRPYMRYGVLVA